MKYLIRKTSRLVIRPLESKDFFTWKQANLAMLKPQNTWDLGGKSPEALTKSEFKKILSGQLEKRKKDLFYDLAVFEKSGAYIGIVSIMEVARGISQTAYLGYRIFNNYWGQGYAKESVKATIDIGWLYNKIGGIKDLS